MVLKFRIRLKAIHEQQGVSYYRAAKASGVAPNTVRKYVSAEYIDSDVLPATIVALAQYYGVSWFAPPLVEIIEVDDEV